MPGWRAFLLKPVPKVRREFRIFSSGSGSDCVGGDRTYHDVSVVIEPELHKPLPNGDTDGFEPPSPRAEDYASDPRWPVACKTCGKAFAEMPHERQVNDSRLYEGCPDGKLYSLHQPELPVGAMWDAWWIEHKKGPDGLTLMMKCPAGEWWIDGTASNGPGWQRTGVPPVITARPSIGIGRRDGKPGFAYHGWLTDGVLCACIDGNHFPEHPFTA